ncbi:hypothetical protein Tco_1328607 [Tanacetum coccineum]
MMMKMMMRSILLQSHPSYRLWNPINPPLYVWGNAAHLSTIPEKKESSVEDLVPILNFFCVPTMIIVRGGCCDDDPRSWEDGEWWRKKGKRRGVKGRIGEEEEEEGKKECKVKYDDLVLFNAIDSAKSETIGVVAQIAIIHTNRVIDDSTDEDVVEYKYLDEDYENLLDDQGNDDVQVDEFLDAFTDELPHLDEFIDDYDYSDTFIDDGPLVEEATEHDSESDD